MKFLQPLLILLCISPINAMHDTSKTDVEHLLNIGYTIDEAALATFQPKYHKLKCTESSLIKSVYFGYNTLPISAIGAAVIATYAVTGDPKSLVVISLGYPLGYFDWVAHERRGAILSNKVARNYLPADYNQHYVECVGIQQALTKEKETNDAFALFKYKQEKRKEKKEDEQLFEEFEALQQESQTPSTLIKEENVEDKIAITEKKNK